MGGTSSTPGEENLVGDQPRCLSYESTVIKFLLHKVTFLEFGVSAVGTVRCNSKY